MTNTENHQLIEITDGLSQAAARISPKYFYDTKGSELFEQITNLPEYYLTRTERAIMASFSEQIGQAVGPHRTVIELGAGSCEKARALFNSIQPERFIAVDIASDFLTDSVHSLRREFPNIDIHAVIADLSFDIKLPADISVKNRLLFYPGSSIGNFDRPDALALLQRFRKLMDDDGALLIGIDLKKDIKILERAYDDMAGVTAAFNLNVLSHINRLIGGNFNITQWQHCAFFNTEESRVEMHLEAKQAIKVCWHGGERQFSAGERIHTENSYKYSSESFLELLSQGGFQQAQIWTDAQAHFAVVLARP